MRFGISNGLIVAAIAAAVAQPASAAVTLYANAYNSDTNQNVTDYKSSGSAVAAAISSGSGGYGFSQFGVNKASAIANNSTFSLQRFSSVSGDSHWFDELTINSNRGSGFFNIALILDETLYVAIDGGRGSNGLSYQFDAISTFGNREYFYLTDGSGGVGITKSQKTTSTLQDFGGGNGLRKIYLSIPWLSGSATYLSSQLSCSATAVASGPPGSNVSAVCNAAHSSYWGGIQSVTDSDGNLITDWSLSSASGTDYRYTFVPAPSAVPELGTWLMLIVGFGVVGATLRFQRAATRIRLADEPLR